MHTRDRSRSLHMLCKSVTRRETIGGAFFNGAEETSCSERGWEVGSVLSGICGCVYMYCIGFSQLFHSSTCYAISYAIDPNSWIITESESNFGLTWTLFRWIDPAASRQPVYRLNSKARTSLHVGPPDGRFGLHWQVNHQLWISRIPNCCVFSFFFLVKFCLIIYLEMFVLFKLVPHFVMDLMAASSDVLPHTNL